LKKKLVKEIEDLIDLIEGLPLHDYAAPSAVQDIARWFAQNSDGRSTISDSDIAGIVRLGVLLEVPGGAKTPFSSRGYCYGHGILLKNSDRDRLIQCLRAILLPGERGNPGKDDSDKLKKAREDRKTFEAEVRLAKAEGRRDPKTRAYERLEKKWNVENRGARERVYAALRITGEEDDDMIPF